MFVYLNGRFVDRAQALVPVEDRAFLFGDGVYEVLRLTAGRFFEPERHERRLRASLEAIEIRHDDADAGRLLGIAREVLARNDLHEGDALVYLQVSRGVAPRRHHYPPAGTAPTVYVSATSFVPRTAECSAGVAAITHPDLRWGRCDIKSVNLLPNVMANQLAHARGGYEAVLLREGVVTEATHSSVFGVVGGELRTHPLGHAVLPGVTREVVLELARSSGIPVREAPMREAELRTAEELFLTGTSTDVMPIVRLDDAAVGVGRPGPVARRLGEALAKWRAEGAPAGALR